MVRLGTAANGDCLCGQPELPILVFTRGSGNGIKTHRRPSESVILRSISFRVRKHESSSACVRFRHVTLTIIIISTQSPVLQFWRERGLDRRLSAHFLNLRFNIPTVCATWRVKVDLQSSRPAHPHHSARLVRVTLVTSSSSYGPRGF